MGDNENRAALTLGPAEQLALGGRVGRPTLLTPEAHKLIVSAVHAGAFSWIAAGTAGIPPSTYHRWMSRGHAEWEAREAHVRAREEGVEDESVPLPELTAFAAFWFDVTKARAMARMSAEQAVKRGNPLAWLTKGPGRDRAGEPGWTETNKVELTGADGGPVRVAALAGTFDLKRLPQADLDALEEIAARAAAPADPDSD